MHELGIAAAALQQTLEHARQNNAARVGRIVFRVGELSGVDTESLRFAFRSLLRGSPAAGATVVMEKVSGKAVCSSCGKSYPTRGSLVPPCPACASPAGAIARGRELEIVSLEFD